MRISNPPPKDVALERYHKAHPSLKICWVCHNAQGKILCAVQSPISGHWGVIVVCRSCRTKTSWKTIFYCEVTK